MGEIVDGVHQKYRNLPQDKFGGIYEEEITNGLSGDAGGYQDFTTFEQVDAPNKVTVARNTITLTAGDRDEDYYVTKDFGTGYFGDLVHWVDVNITSLANDTQSATAVWALSNAHDDLNDIDDASGSAICLWARRSTADTHFQFRLIENDAGTLDDLDQSSEIAVNTSLFLVITRSGTTWTVDIYSTAALRASGAGGDIDTISGTSIATAFKRVYGMASSNNSGTNKDVSGTVSNLWLRT